MIRVLLLLTALATGLASPGLIGDALASCSNSNCDAKER